MRTTDHMRRAIELIAQARTQHRHGHLPGTRRLIRDAGSHLQWADKQIERRQERQREAEA